MSWITKNSLNAIQLFCVKVLKFGPVPKHVAFIMDGNRRFAKKHKCKTIDGHSKGFDKLSETLQWCLEFGITEVTVYAFSIENFKRSKDEVEALLELAKEKFTVLLNECENLMYHGVRIRIIGNWSLIPDDIKKLISRAELLTKGNCKCFLNVAFAYTEYANFVIARDEMVHAVNTIVNGVNEGLINEEDVSTELMTRCLHTRSSLDPDLVIRTSGETRLSDFLLWQSSYSYLYFTDVLWPNFSAWDLMSAVFQFQRSYKKLQFAKEEQLLYRRQQRTSGPLEHSLEGITKDGAKFLEVIDDRYWENILKILAT